MRDSGTGPTVFVVDDDRSSRREHAGLIEGQGWRVELFCSAEEFLAAHTCRPPVGCLVLEAELPGISGLELQHHIRQQGWTLPVIFLSRCGTVAKAVQAMRAGAVTFLERPADSETLTRWVRVALAVDARLREQIAQRDRLCARLDLLSQREREVLQHVVAGKSSKEIAAELFLSGKTVQLHRARIMKKTGAANVAELVSMANAAEEVSVVSATRTIVEQVLTQS